MYFAVTSLALFSLVSCIPQPEQPLVLVCILARNAAPTLPYFLGHIEELDYPKDKLRINTYESIDFKSDPAPVSYPGEKGPFHWTKERHRRVMELKEEVLEEARNSEVEYILFLDTDVFLTNDQVLRRLISSNRVLVAPLLKTSVNEYSNFLDNIRDSKTERYSTIFLRRKLGCFPVPLIHMVFLVDVRTTTRSYHTLTFIPENLSSYGEKPMNDKLVFAQSAKAANINLHILNTEDLGYALVEPRPGSSSQELKSAMNKYLLHLMREDFMPLLYSPFVEPIFPDITNQGLDQVYYINLERRRERVRHMNAWLRAVGLNATRWPGVDGNTLMDDYIRNTGVSFLPVYRCKYDQRPITVGEVGCLLSHLSIWRDIIKNGYKKVAILEDDIIFESYFQTQLHDVLSDIEYTDLDWDLIFLTRASGLKENTSVLPGHRFLANNIRHGAWTGAYLLSQSGAQKLVNAKPGKNMLPADEFLAIMYDQHLNETYKAYFPIRNLIAFTMKPLVVRPSKVYVDPDNVSDTDGKNCKTFRIDEKSKSFHLKDEL